jgi:hypothetical protein
MRHRNFVRNALAAALLSSSQQHLDQIEAANVDACISCRFSPFASREGVVKNPLPALYRESQSNPLKWIIGLATVLLLEQGYNLSKCPPKTEIEPTS